MRKLCNFIRVRVMQGRAVPFAIPYLESIDIIRFVGYLGYSIPFIYKDLYIVVVGRYIY
jgi:hypothetical protein